MSKENENSNWIHEIVERYEKPLCQYAYSILRNADIAREVVQDTFLKLCMQGREYIQPRIPAWLFRVCRNRAIDVIRKEKRVNTLTPEREAVLASNDPTPSEAAIVRDGTSHLLKLLASLPDNQQEVIRLKFQQDMTYKQIATVTSLSESNVGYLIHVGLKDLRRQMLALQGV